MFLFSRVLKEGKDSRFNKVRGDPKMFWVYWTIQGKCVEKKLHESFLPNINVHITIIVNLIDRPYFFLFEERKLI